MNEKIISILKMTKIRLILALVLVFLVGLLVGQKLFPVEVTYTPEVTYTTKDYFTISNNSTSSIDISLSQEDFLSSSNVTPEYTWRYKWTVYFNTSQEAQDYFDRLRHKFSEFPHSTVRVPMGDWWVYTYPMSWLFDVGIQKEKEYLVEPVIEVLEEIGAWKPNSYSIR